MTFVISREIGEGEMGSFYSQANLRIEIALLIVPACLLTQRQLVNNTKSGASSPHCLWGLRPTMEAACPEKLNTDISRMLFSPLCLHSSYAHGCEETEAWWVEK